MAAQTNRISQVDFFRLCQLVKKDYKSSTLSNPKFAVYAAEQLKCAVAASSVDSALEATGTKSNKAPRGSQGNPESKGNVHNRMRSLEDKVAKLEGALLALQVELGVSK